MKKVILILSIFLLTATPASAQKTDVKKSLVKIFKVFKTPDYNQPWDSGKQETASGTGFIIEGNKILTNAHVVSDQVFIQVQKANDPKKYIAEVMYAAHDCEIAMLKVDDPEFFKNTIPVTFGDIPFQLDKVTAYGFPVGGDTLSITEGVVSRIEVTEYAHNKKYLLAIQIDAAINPGNSGGPVFHDDKCIGIAFQGTRNTDNIGYIVPVTLIKRFLKDIEDKTYHGIASAGITFSKIENPAMRKYYNLKKDDSGIVVTNVSINSSADGLLKKDDIITNIAGYEVAYDGTFKFRNNERLHISHIFSSFQIGDTVDLKIIRDGEQKNITLTFKKNEPLVPNPIYDINPTYYIFSGFVFMPLTYNMIADWRGKGHVSSFIHYYTSMSKEKPNQQIVMLTKVLAHSINIGYHNIEGAFVEKINGREIINIKDVNDAFMNNKNDFHVIEIKNNSTRGSQKIIFDARKSIEANKEIMKKFDINQDRSEDLI